MSNCVMAYALRELVVQGKRDKLFNIEMWEAGTTFPLRFELIVRQQDNVMRAQAGTGYSTLRFQRW